MSQYIREDIFQRIEELFDKKITDFKEIQRGLLNLKWIVTFDDHPSVFVKQYNPARYSKKLPFIKAALAIQETLQKQGIRCPKVYKCNGEHLLTSSRGDVFTILEIMSGYVISPGGASREQIYSLGLELGRLHQALSKIPSAPLYWVPDRESIQQKWERQMALAREKQPTDRVILMLHKQKEILDTLDFSQFDQCRRGWTHWDMYLDNVLFEDQQVSAILDFDRIRYVYPDLDVARALLSSCFSKEKRMDQEKVAAFLAGYQEYSKDYTTEDNLRALQLLRLISRSEVPIRNGSLRKLNGCKRTGISWSLYYCKA